MYKYDITATEELYKRRSFSLLAKKTFGVVKQAKQNFPPRADAVAPLFQKWKEEEKTKSVLFSLRSSSLWQVEPKNYCGLDPQSKRVIHRDAEKTAEPNSADH